MALQQDGLPDGKWAYHDGQGPFIKLQKGNFSDLPNHFSKVFGVILNKDQKITDLLVKPENAGKGHPTPFYNRSTQQQLDQVTIPAISKEEFLSQAGIELPQSVCTELGMQLPQEEVIPDYVQYKPLGSYLKL